jgi:2-oxo-3-hexenedioate decarboxylase
MHRAGLEAIADEMKAAQDLCKQIEPLTARLSGFDNAAAYDVAHFIHEARVREGASPVGRKIGFTNRDMWLSLPRFRGHLRYAASAFSS